MAISWISRKHLKQHLDALTSSASDALSGANPRRERNVIDPFGSLVVASSLDIGVAQELNNVQDAESALRGMSNALGRFHQNVLGSIRGWRNHDSGLRSRVRRETDTCGNQEQAQHHEQVEPAAGGGRPPDRHQPEIWQVGCLLGLDHATQAPTLRDSNRLTGPLRDRRRIVLPSCNRRPERSARLVRHCVFRACALVRDCRTLRRDIGSQSAAKGGLMRHQCPTTLAEGESR